MKFSSPVAASPGWIAQLPRLLSFLPILLCLLAFGLRVFRLDFQPIWFDEDLAYQRATATLNISLASMDGSPLYYLFLRGWVELTGSSLYALRFFSALCGTLALPLIYQVTRRLLGRKVALATLTVAVFAPFYIYYSQEARTYSLTLVLMLISMHAFLRWQDTQQRRALVICTLANLVCLYTHYVAALMIVVQGIILLLLQWRDWKRLGVFVAAQTIAVLALVPWLIYAQRLLPRVIAPADSTTSDAWSILARTWTEFSVGRTIAPPISLYLAIIPLFLALVGLVSLFAPHQRRRTSSAAPQRKSVRRAPPASSAVSDHTITLRDSRLILLVWLIIPIVGTLLIPRASVRFSPKYLIAITPAFYMLLVLGLQALRRESRALFIIGLALLIGIWLGALGDYYLRPHDKLAQAPGQLVEMRGERRLIETDTIVFHSISCRTNQIS
jgi:mannosyltransferase